MKFIIPLPPKAQKRARSRAVMQGNKAFSMTYKDKAQRLEEDKFIALLIQHRPPEPLQGALMLRVKAYLPVPKSKPKKWQTAAMLGEIRPTTKPDCSNMLKNLEDVMSGIFFEDDKQLVAVSISKFWGVPARWEIEIRDLKSNNL